jgi:hypothetical protein
VGGRGGWDLIGISLNSLEAIRVLVGGRGGWDLICISLNSLEAIRVLSISFDSTIISNIDIIGLKNCYSDYNSILLIEFGTNISEQCNSTLILQFFYPHPNPGTY